MKQRQYIVFHSNHALFTAFEELSSKWRTHCEDQEKCERFAQVSKIDKSDPILPNNKAIGYRSAVYTTINHDIIQ